MTRIDFYRYAEDKQHYACRLAARASRSNKVVVYSPDPALLERFDKALWTYQATGFVPHVRAGSPLAAETPIVLSPSGEGLPHHDVLLNLGDEWPPFFATFDRLLDPWLSGFMWERYAAITALVSGGVAIYGVACFVTRAFTLGDIKALVRKRRSSDPIQE